MHCIDKNPKAKGKKNAIRNKGPYIVKRLIKDNISQYKEVGMISMKDKLLLSKRVYLTLSDLMEWNIPEQNKVCCLEV